LSKLNLSDSLTELPFNKIFFKLAVPNVCATFFAASTVIFDLWYIGKIGISELAGVAYIFPIYMLTSMLSNGAFGGAVSGATARAFGSKNITQAECIFRSAILIAILGAIIMMLLFLCAHTAGPHTFQDSSELHVYCNFWLLSECQNILPLLVEFFNMRECMLKILMECCILYFQ